MHSNKIIPWPDLILGLTVYSLCEAVLTFYTSTDWIDFSISMNINGEKTWFSIDDWRYSSHIGCCHQISEVEILKIKRSNLCQRENEYISTINKKIHKTWIILFQRLAAELSPTFEDLGMIKCEESVDLDMTVWAGVYQEKERKKTNNSSGILKKQSANKSFYVNELGEQDEMSEKVRRHWLNHFFDCYQNTDREEKRRASRILLISHEDREIFW